MKWCSQRSYSEDGLRTSPHLRIGTEGSEDGVLIGNPFGPVPSLSLTSVSTPDRFRKDLRANTMDECCTLEMINLRFPFLIGLQEKYPDSFG
ncbi:hypothetical protein J6590_016372 [Homalodisca vitripennis]|nr:hypothetical protein J6590_016372 [Homalodisca vitripennis]